MARFTALLEVGLDHKGRLRQTLADARTRLDPLEAVALEPGGPPNRISGKRPYLAEGNYPLGTPDARYGTDDAAARAVARLIGGHLAPRCGPVEVRAVHLGAGHWLSERDGREPGQTLPDDRRLVLVAMREYGGLDGVEAIPLGPEDPGSPGTPGFRS